MSLLQKLNEVDQLKGKALSVYESLQEERDRFLKALQLLNLQWKNKDTPTGKLKTILEHTLGLEDGDEYHHFSADVPSKELSTSLPFLGTFLPEFPDATWHLQGVKITQGEQKFLLVAITLEDSFALPFFDIETGDNTLAFIIPLTLGLRLLRPQVVVFPNINLKLGNEKVNIKSIGTFDVDAAELQFSLISPVDIKRAHLTGLFSKARLELPNWLPISESDAIQLSALYFTLQVPLENGKARNALKSGYMGLSLANALKFWDGKIKLNELELGISTSQDDPFSASINASTRILGAHQNLSLELPDGRFELLLEALKPNDIVQQLSNNALALPGFLAELEVERFYLQGNVSSKEFSVSTSLLHSLSINHHGLEMKLDADLSIVKSSKGISVDVEGNLEIGDFHFGLKAIIEGDTQKLTANTTQLEMKAVVEKLLQVDYPDFLPNPSIETLSLDIENSGDLRISGKVTDSQGLGVGDSQIQLKELGFEFTRSKTDDGFNLKANLNTKGELNIQDALVLEHLDFELEYNFNAETKKGSWLAKTSEPNGIKASIFGHTINLFCSFESNQQKQKLLFNLANPFPAIGIPNMVEFGLKEVVFALEKTESKTSLRLSSKSWFKTDVFSYNDLQATLYYETGEVGIKLEPAKDGKTSEISFAPGKHIPSLTIAKPNFTLSYLPKKKEWHSTGRATFQFKNVPEVLKGFITSTEIDGYFTFNEEKAEIGLEYDGGLTIPLPPKVEGIETGDVDLGALFIGLHALKINLKGKGKLTGVAALGLPLALNDFFAASDGTKTEVFRTFDPSEENDAKRRDGLIKFGLSLDDSGFFFEMVNSPFKQFIEIIDNRIHLNMGAYGAIAFKLPTLKVEGKASVSGNIDIEITKPLAIPLTPLKWFLKLIGLEDAGKVFHDAIPIQKLEFAPIDSNTGKRKFDSKALIRLVGDPDKIELPNEVNAAIGLMEQFVSRLPDSLMDYGNFVMPTYLYLDLEYNATQSLNLKFTTRNPNTDEAVPIKLLFPADPYMTQLQGIKISGFSIGELFGGNLLRMDVDAEFDQFNIIDLGASLAIDPTWDVSKKYLPNPKDFRQRLVLKNTTFIIIYQAGFPIPVPLFFDELSFSYLSILGTQVESSFKFPMPKLGLDTMKAIGIIAGEAFSFFKNINNNPKLDVDKLKKISFPSFTIGENYIRTAKFISRERKETKGIRLGSPIGLQSEVDINAFQMFCSLLEALQDRSFNTLLKSVELHKRLGSFELSLFDVLDIEAKYAFVTPKEFTEKAYPSLNLSQDTASEYLAVLPKPSEKEDVEGLVIFLQGKVHLPSVTTIHTGVGFLGSTNGIGIGGGLDIEMLKIGSAPPLVKFRNQGVFALSKQGGLNWIGSTNLELLGVSLASGSFKFSNEEFYLKAKVGNAAWPIHFDGHAAGQLSHSGMHLKGRTQLRIFCFSQKGTLEIKDKPNDYLFQAESKTQFLGSQLAFGFKSVLNESEAGLATYINGNLSSYVTFSLENALFVDAAKQEMGASGSGYLKVLDHTLVNLKYKWVNATLTLEDCSIDLFGPSLREVIDVRGSAKGLITPEKLELDGETHGSIMKYRLGDTSLKIRGSKIELLGHLFGVKFKAQLDASSESYSFDGTIAPISVGPLLLEGTGSYNEAKEDEYQGPRLSIAANHFFLDAKASFLGISHSLRVALNKSTFALEFEGKFLGVTSGKLTVSGSNLGKDSALWVKGSIYPEAFVSKIEEELLGAARHIVNAMKSARDQVDAAKERAFKAAKAVKEDLDGHRKALEARFEEAKRVFDAAESKLNDIRNDLNGLQSQINSLHNQNARERGWAEAANFWQKGYRWAVYGAWFVGFGIRLGALEGSKLVVEGLLAGAKLGLDIARKSLDSLKDIGQLVSEMVDSALNELKKKADGFLAAAESGLELLEHGVGKFEEWGKSVQAARKNLLSIHEISMNLGVDQMKKQVLATADVTIMGKRTQYEVLVDFTRLDTLAQSLVENIKHDRKPPRLLAHERKQKSIGGKKTAEDIRNAYPQIDPIQMGLTMKRGGYSMTQIGEGLSIYRGERDIRAQLLVKALRIAQEEAI